MIGKKRKPSPKSSKIAETPTAESEQAINSKKENSRSFPIVGIGSSAGGLEALEIFLKNIPLKSGMAFVIVQHLDPTHKGIMVELLQRVTDLDVVQVTDCLRIEPDHVYLIPPNKDMSVLHGSLHLLDMVQPRGLRLPIDFFFRSMADDMQQRSIGVILSGMGSDGTLGLRDIKEKGGGVFVQEPSSAKFDGMPRSAIEAGLADVIAPVEKLPSSIINYLHHFPLYTKPDISHEIKVQSALEKVVILLRTQTGHDFSLYKKNTVYRRIERRMGIHQIDKIIDYVHFLQGNPQETELLFKELLIGVTSFFRDPAVWETLKTQAIPSLLSSRPSGGTIRAWVTGCSTGEEAYSLAMILKEAIESMKLSGNFRILIFASDLDKEAIEKARLGTYPLNISADVSQARLQRFFEKDDRGYKVSRELRETVVFAPHNVLMDPPFTKLDILVCRNLLIYMELELQRKLLPLFHYSLNPGGVLVLGSAETIGSSNNLFESIDGKSRIFRQLSKGVRSKPLDFPAAFNHTTPVISADNDFKQPYNTSEVNLQAMTDQVLLNHYAPAAVLTNENGDIIYINGRTGKYLEPAAGKANWNIFAMAREGLRFELTTLFGNAIKNKSAVSKNGVMIRSNGDKDFVNLRIEQLEKPDQLCGLVLIVFEDVKQTLKVDPDGSRVPVPMNQKNILSLQLDLKAARDEIVTIREQMQTSQEELKSTNEEMQSANEEMQSTNEELTTSKEEMQSLNEELQTVNQELQSKVSDLSQVNNDMKNLLNSTEIATLFLDNELNIRRFTTCTSTIIKLIGSDIGRPVTDIVTDLNYATLANDARDVLHTLVYSEKQVSATDGRWFTVRIMPYRTQENRIDGVVITFFDITEAKKIEQSWKDSDESFRFLFEAIPGGILIQNSEGRIIMANREAQRILGFPISEMQGKTMPELRWKIVREDGSALPYEEHPASVALRTGLAVSESIIGMIQAPNLSCLWIKANVLPRLDAKVHTTVQIYTFFLQIRQPESKILKA